MTAGSDVALTGAVGQRANQLAEDVFCKPRNHNCWISPAAFALPAAGTLGNAGRSNVAGPGFYGIDMAVSRIFRVRESISLEARGEAFNQTNSVRLNAPITARNNNSNFGTVRTARDPRIMQVALKLVF